MRKWNKIEHRMFCYNTLHWRGRPLESREIVVNLIGSRTIGKALYTQAALEMDVWLPLKIKVTSNEMEALRT